MRAYVENAKTTLPGWDRRDTTKPTTFRQPDRESVALRVVAVVQSSSESVARSHPSRVPRPARRVAGAVENHRGKKANFKVVVRL